MTCPEKPDLQVLVLAGMPIDRQLALEEALFRADRGNWFVWNDGTEPAVVMGISGSVADLIDAHHWNQHRLPLVRRFSGGGTVVVGVDTLFFALIVENDALPIAPYPDPILRWTASLWCDLFPREGFALCAQDYTFRNQKWGGNAQSIGKDRWLHHGTLVWDYDREHMRCLTVPSRAPSYRGGRTHEEFLLPLKTLFADRATIWSHVVARLAQHFTLKFMDRSAAEDALARPHRKTVHVQFDDTPYDR